MVMGALDGRVLDDLGLIAPIRTARPNEFRDPPGQACPFCRGNEAETPPQLGSIDAPDGRWIARAFANRFPAAQPPDGDHEVIVDTPEHAPAVTLAGIQLWRERYARALERYANAMPVLFKNAGASAGATIRHPHTQLLTIARPIPYWERLSTQARAYAMRTGECCWCQDLRTAGSQARVVAARLGVVAFVPSRQRFDGLLRIVPERCEPSFALAQAAELQGLASLLGAAASALQADAFNVYFEGDPHAERGVAHWHADVVPRATTLAGFELASELPILAAGPQESAERWRQMLT